MKASLLLAGVLITILLVPLSAMAGFASQTQSTGTSFAADVLQPPGAPASSHPSPTSGTVELSWTASPSSYVSEYWVQRASSPSGPFDTIASVEGTSYADNSALYNNQYYYRTIALYKNWTAQDDATMALSLPPTWGLDTTGLLDHSLGAGALSDLAVADGSRYTTQGTWPLLAYSGLSYLELTTSPVVLPDAQISSVHATLTYRMNTFVSGATMRLQVSGDGGASWTSYPLPRPGASGVDVQMTVDVTSVINSQSNLTNMRLRFQATSNMSLITGLTFRTSHDLVHVDVN